MRYRIIHKTSYDYAEPFASCHNLVHLTPRRLDTQACAAHRVAVYPEPESVAVHTDWFGNAVQSFEVRTPSRALVITALSEVDLTPRQPGLFDQSASWRQVAQSLASEPPPELLDPLQYLFDSAYVRATPALVDYARPSFSAQRSVIDVAADLMARIHRDFTYDPRATTLSTSLPEVLARRRGVCQDFAHLMIGCLRSMGLAARYVSGYLRTDPPPGRPRLVGADASHAWVSVWCPSLGWTDLDPTNDIIPDQRHITLAWGRDYADVSPIRGIVHGGGAHRVSVSVDVSPM